MAKRAQAPTADATTALPPVGPADLATRYNFPAGDATGQTIAIGEFGGGYSAADLADYCNRFGVVTPTVHVQPLQTGYDMEVNMDVQIVAGLCPGATIYLFFATWGQDGWLALVNTVLQMQPAPVALSISWGWAEDDSTGPNGWAAGALDAINSALGRLALAGVTVCASSGDDGSGADQPAGCHVEFPASSPYVLAVGGTMLVGDAPPVAEQVWWQSPGYRDGSGGGATGGGVSMVYQRPPWQTVTVTSLNAGSIDGRVVPDIAALAGPPYYALNLNGEPYVNWGTSASTPMWAALIARINALLPAGKQQRFLTPLLYQPSPASAGQPVGQVACNAVTIGNNASNPNPGVGYQAGPGYSAVTGWGTPDGAKLLSELTNLTR
jgi:kumamolisin